MMKEILITELDYYARIKCGLCGTHPCVADIKTEMEKGFNWTRVPFTGKFLCPVCIEKITKE